MKFMAIVIVLLPLGLLAQSPPTNPVVSAARADLDRQSRNLVRAAEEMPANKYDFRPTPQQMTFAHLAAHIAQSNQFLCAKLSGTEAPKPLATDKDPKETLVSALKNSFDTCAHTLDQLQDAALAQPVTLWGGRNTTKAGALLALTSDWADHYAAAAMYLRLNGLLPPTAKGRQE